MQTLAGTAKLGVWVRRIAVIAIASVSVASFSLAAGASSGSGLQGKSAEQVWALAVAAAESKGSVHMVEKPFLCCGATNVFGKNGELVTDDGQSEGSQTVSSGGMYGQAMFLVVPGTAYMQGDTSWTTLIWSWPSFYAGKWIAIPSSNSNYQSALYGVTLGTLLSAEKPTGHLTLTPKTTIRGKKMVGVSGGMVTTDWPSDVKGSVVVYVSAVAPYLPVESVFHVTENGHKTTVSDTFSNWGEPISVTAPASSVPYPSG